MEVKLPSVVASIVHAKPPTRSSYVSRFEQLAAACAVAAPSNGLRTAVAFQQLFSVGFADQAYLALLDATNIPRDIGCAVLQPLWAEEAIHRAYVMLQLMSGLRRRRSRQRKARPIASWKRALANDLALAYQSLPHADEAQVLDCSAILSRVAVDLGALFGSGGRQLYVNATAECILLQIYKRRALVLLASELVANAILHAFHGRCSGRIDVSLRHLGNGQARLRVADDGIGFSGGLPNFRPSVAAALAGLLEANVRYEAISGWTTVADVVFPAL